MFGYRGWAQSSWIASSLLLLAMTIFQGRCGTDIRGVGTIEGNDIEAVGSGTEAHRLLQLSTAPPVLLREFIEIIICARGGSSSTLGCQCRLCPHPCPP